MNDKIYLRLDIDEEGRKRILDQHGREVHGVSAIESRCAVDAIDMLTVTFCEADAEGEIITNGRHRHG